MTTLKGKVAIITGATRGFGFALAHQFSQAGAKVIIASRSQDSVDQAIKSLHKLGFEASGIKCDISNHKDVENLANYTLSIFDHFDVWVNNAAQSAPYGPTIDVPPQDFERVVQTNILGTYYGTMVALRHFLDQGMGKLINILGAGDRRNHPMQNAYSSSKAWEIRFTKTLAEEYKDSGIGVYALNPGMMSTEMLTNLTVIEGYESRLSSMDKVIRMFSSPPEKPAQKAVWLASAETDGRTGLIIHQSSMGTILKGVIGETFRGILKRPTDPIEINITSMPSAFKAENAKRE